MPTHYINTDLKLSAPTELAPMTTALEARGYFTLYDREVDSHWESCCETGEQYDDPEPNIAAMLSVIEALDGPAKEVWQTCSIREFDIGYEGGYEPFSLKQGLSNEVLRRVVESGASLMITVYRAEPGVGPDEAEDAVDAD